MSDQPSKEAMERAGALAHCTCGLRETTPHDEGCPIWHIARAIDEALREARATCQARLDNAAEMLGYRILWSGLWKRAAKGNRQFALHITRSAEMYLEQLERVTGTQPCGHPAACIVGTGEGTNHCAWCEDVARVKREAWRDMRHACAEAVTDPDLYKGAAIGEVASIAHREAMNARVRSKQC